MIPRKWGIASFPHEGCWDHWCHTLWSQDVGISAVLIPRAMGPLSRLRDTITRVDTVSTIFSTCQGILRICKLISPPSCGYFSLLHSQPCFPFSSYHNSFLGHQASVKTKTRYPSYLQAAFAFSVATPSLRQQEQRINWLSSRIEE